jgi:DNA-binding transcriptional ArsR family regulator
MDESNRPRDPTRTPGEEPFGAPATEVPDRGERESPDETAASDAFGALASEARVAALVELLAAERSDEDPLTFSELQAAAGVEESAGFAYHLRQLTGRFLSREGEGYELTPAGRRAACAVVSGAFTERGQAS